VGTTGTRVCAEETAPSGTRTAEGNHPNDRKGHLDCRGWWDYGKIWAKSQRPFWEPSVGGAKSPEGQGKVQITSSCHTPGTAEHSVMAGAGLLVAECL
jgi:hypothetical protein